MPKWKGNFREREKEREREGRDSICSVGACLAESFSPFLLVSGKGCGSWLWHSLDFSLTFVFCKLVEV